MMRFSPPLPCQAPLLQSHTALLALKRRWQVDGVPAWQLGPACAQALLYGRANSSVALRVWRGGAAVRVTLRRESALARRRRVRAAALDAPALAAALAARRGHAYAPDARLREALAGALAGAGAGAGALAGAGAGAGAAVGAAAAELVRGMGAREVQAPPPPPRPPPPSY